MPGSDPVAQTLDVPGARLYFERRGDGPLLLMIGSPMVAHRSAVALAERFGTPVAEFPGDHVGFVTLPEQCAQVLNQVLTQPA